MTSERPRKNQLCNQQFHTYYRKFLYIIAAHMSLTRRGGFEPPDRFPGQRLSRAPQSASLPSPHIVPPVGIEPTPSRFSVWCDRPRTPQRQNSIKKFQKQIPSLEGDPKPPSQ